jgi:hypothetical protein
MRLIETVRRQTGLLAGGIVGGALGPFNTKIEPKEFNPSETKNNSLSAPPNEKVLFVQGRGANPPDKNGKFNGDNAYEQAQDLSDYLELPVALIPLSNNTGLFKGIREEIKGVFHRLVGTYNPDTAKQLAKYILENINNGQELDIVLHSAGGFPGLAGLKMVADKLTPEQKNLIKIVFAGSPVATQDIERLRNLGFDNISNLINRADEIPNCVGGAGVGWEAWLYALGIGKETTLKGCTTEFREEHSMKEISKAHRIENYFPAIKEVFNRK